MTPFQQRVYEFIREVPRGKVTTYRAIAKALHCRSAQAIGQALKRNPLAPEVPCHRVIRADLTLGGYSGQTAGKKMREKLALLKSEGVEFVDGRLKDSARVWPEE
ncbi:MGMT family protein [Prosthecobacter sp.]|uniref:MGMT family protein n=1 Tax=Prosthecobacter sp. TaxID=1965333 RepID=UPI002ABA44A9|nr:MGMT family protein [Prosthecobacter sp.]MDZ4401061.1 MGMT family protein [Prosthecobacter sp.]